MEEFLDQVRSLFQALLAMAQGGFDGVNQVVGLIIALIAALMMPSWRSLWGTAVGAVIVDRLVVMLRPALDGGSIALPDIMTQSFWMTAFALFLGYAIVVAIFFLLKTILTGTAFRSRARAH